MKKLILLLACAGLCTVEAFTQDVIVKPAGAQIQSLRNDGKSEIIIPGCEEDGLRMDDINNLYGNNWSFYLVGTVEKLSDITVKPPCSASKIGLQKGCGYVACYNSGRGNKYVRLYVTKMVNSKSDEIIGATILYDWDYQMERAEEGVIINGVTWATKNIGAASPEDYGNYYTWEEAQKACPKGWRLPTARELESLAKSYIDHRTNRWSSTVEIHGVTGYKFGTNESNIFLPSAGYRWYKSTDVTKGIEDKAGFYWSSERSDWAGEQLGIMMEFSQGMDPRIGTYDIRNGYTVRCVKE